MNPVPLCVTCNREAAFFSPTLDGPMVYCLGCCYRLVSQGGQMRLW